MNVDEKDDFIKCRDDINDLVVRSCPIHRFVYKLCSSYCCNINVILVTGHEKSCEHIQEKIH